jgi:retinol dehydrogenase 12
MPKVVASPFRPILHEPRFGVYSELFAGLSPDVTIEHSGQYLIPWGRLGQPREDITKGCLSTQEGGTGTAKRFWEWCEMECKDGMERSEGAEL